MPSVRGDSEASGYKLRTTVDLDPAASNGHDADADPPRPATMVAMTSLAILNPAPSDLPTPKSTRKSSTAQYLEHKTRRIVEYIDKKDFDNAEIKELLTSEFSAVSVERMS